MKRTIAMISFLLIFSIISNVQAQTKRFDTTVKMGEYGYRVECNNKDSIKNILSISPVGFRINQSSLSFQVQGRIYKAMIDDFNDDGYPDLVICIYTGDIVTALGVSSSANKNLVPIYFPDIYLDPKIRDGYKGHDVYSTLTGTLLRKFPIYLSGDAPDKPTGGTRTVQYNVTKEDEKLSFKVLRSFDVKG